MPPGFCLAGKVLRDSRSLDKNWSLEFGDWRLEFGDWRLEFRVWSLEFGDWSLEIGVWEIGDWRECRSNSFEMTFFFS